MSDKKDIGKKDVGKKGSDKKDVGKKSFSEKVNAFLFGEPIPVLSKNDLNVIHKLDGKIDSLLTMFDTPPNGREPALSLAEGTAAPPPPENVHDLADQVRKLAKTQFKANTLQEKQLAQQQETIAGLQKSIEQHEDRLAELAQQRREAVELARLDLLKSLLPVIDGLDAAFNSGRRQVLKHPMPPETRQAIIAWLDGIRLARIRLLEVLAAHQVTPIPAVGEPFNPHLHVAVATDSSGRAPDGIIINEDRRGYATPNNVLRFAEVVVAQTN